jgi:signal transduction histidine kinase
LDRRRLRALATDVAIAEERERRRIAGGLHDQVAQLLGVAKIKLGEVLVAAPDETVVERVSESRDLLDRAIAEIRALSFELSSPVLRELGIEAALDVLLERTERRHGIPCRFEHEAPPAALPEEVALLVYSIVRELLWNAVRYAGAQLLTLTIDRHGDWLRIVVADDGVGFDPESAFEGLSEKGGLGLYAARERLEYLGGMLEIDSAPREGARITLLVPQDQ